MTTPALPVATAVPFNPPTRKSRNPTYDVVVLTLPKIPGTWPADADTLLHTGLQHWREPPVLMGKPVQHSCDKTALFYRHNRPNVSAMAVIVFHFRKPLQPASIRQTMLAQICKAAGLAHPQECATVGLKTVEVLDKIYSMVDYLVPEKTSWSG